MTRPRRFLGLLTLAALAGPLAGPGSAQHVIYAPAPATSSAPVVVTRPGTVVYAPAPAYAVGPTRRELRRGNQYTTYRPTYGRRQAVTFAPYSDRYFPTAGNTPPATATYYAPGPTYYVVPPR